MWEKEMTPELEDLFSQYREKFWGAEPDEYDELEYSHMSYDRFVGYIKKCLETGKEMPEVVPW